MNRRHFLQLAATTGGLSMANAAPGADSKAEPASHAPSLIALEDQFGRRHELRFPREQPLILTLADKQGAPQVDIWVATLKEQIQNRLEIRGIASLGNPPGFLHNRLRQEFQKRYPHPVLMDWKGDVSRHLHHVEKVANVLFILPDGRIAARHSGSCTKPACDQLVATINQQSSHPSHPPALP